MYNNSNSILKNIRFGCKPGILFRHERGFVSCAGYKPAVIDQVDTSAHFLLHDAVDNKETFVCHCLKSVDTIIWEELFWRIILDIHDFPQEI